MADIETNPEQKDFLTKSLGFFLQDFQDCIFISLKLSLEDITVFIFGVINLDKFGFILYALITNIQEC